jgi:flagellar hook-length control protein FliK
MLGSILAIVSVTLCGEPGAGGCGSEQASGKPQQNKPALDLKSETALPELNKLTDGSEVKTSAGIAGDIARMSAAVRNDAASSTVPANQASMQKHLSDPGWHQELGEKLIWMNKQSTPSVELRLNPEHLGPVLIKIDVSQDQATVAFTTQHQAVKEAIEAAIPKLKEMLQGQQLNLTDVNVSQQQSEQRQSARDFFQMASNQGRQQANGADVSETGVVNEAQNIVDEIEAGRAIASNGLLSLFA